MTQISSIRAAHDRSRPGLLARGGMQLNRLVARLLLALIRVYQLTLSPLIGNQCRFHPTCSHYAAEAITTHGPWRGGLLAVRRLARCNPFHPGGIDDVPAGSGEPSYRHSGV